MGDAPSRCTPAFCRQKEGPPTGGDEPLEVSLVQIDSILSNGTNGQETVDASCGKDSVIKIASTSASSADKVERDFNQSANFERTQTALSTTSSADVKIRPATFMSRLPKMSCLSKVPLMRSLPQGLVPSLAESMSHISFSKGEVMLSDSDDGADFYVIRSGEVQILTSVSSTKLDGKDKKVATLRRGDYFVRRGGAIVGDTAVSGFRVPEHRQARLVASKDVSCYKIGKATFLELGLSEKLQFGKLDLIREDSMTSISEDADLESPDMGNSGSNPNWVRTYTPQEKTHADRKFLTESLQRNAALKQLMKLTDEIVEYMVDAFWREHVQVGEEVTVEGDLNADYFYIVERGRFEVIQTVDGDSDRKKIHIEEATPRSNSSISALGPGGSFGEMSLFCKTKDCPTVRATELSQVWVIDRLDFKEILYRIEEEQIRQSVEYLNSLSIFEHLSAAEKESVARALDECVFKKDEVVFSQGDPGTAFYILCEGQVAILVDGKKVNSVESIPAEKKVSFFGEVALLGDTKRTATVQVSSFTARALTLDRDSFNMLLGPLRDSIGSPGNGKRRQYRLPKGDGEEDGKRVKREDILIHEELESATFGPVTLVSHKWSGERYVLKTLSKGLIVKLGMQESICRERELWAKASSPFIVRFFAAYSEAESLFLLLEYASGGKLPTLYKANRKLYGSAQHVQYHTAGMVYALTKLHQIRIIFRDLRPENILIGVEGKPKLTDFALAKFVIGKTYTVVGVPDYTAPEVLVGSGHGRAVDWWALGVLIYELMASRPPFQSDSPTSVYSNVMRGISRVEFPNSVGNAGNLVRALLRDEPCERLAMRAGAQQNVMDHRFFKGFDWKAMKDGSLKPPPIPESRATTRKGSCKSNPPRASGMDQIVEDEPSPPWSRQFSNASAASVDLSKYGINIDLSDEVLHLHVPYVDDGSGWDKDWDKDVS